MRIDDNNLASISASTTAASQQIRAADKQGTNTAKVGSDSTGGDEVQLSSVAGRVSASSLSTAPSVSAERSARIAQLTKLVQSGQYSPDPEKVADSMIGDMMSGAGSS
jgi:flagellar biosynthesis anti-sigma factor FlgM